VADNFLPLADALLPARAAAAGKRVICRNEYGRRVLAVVSVTSRALLPGLGLPLTTHAGGGRAGCGRICTPFAVVPHVPPPRAGEAVHGAAASAEGRSGD
jgi:hypothetical protein